MNTMIPSYVLKQRAWKAIKPWMQVLIIIGLLAVLPGLITDVAGQLMSDDLESAVMGPAADLMEFAEQPLPEQMTNAQALGWLLEAESLSLTFLREAWDFFREKGWILLALSALSALLTPMLTVPLYGALMDAQRKKEISFPGAMRHLRLGPKALLLSIWMTLRIYAWMLPGMALMFVAMLLPSLGSLLLTVGFIASMVLGVRAALHYGLAPIALLDQPKRSLNGCIRASWQVMRTRKMEYFMLQVSFIGWHLLIQLISYLAVNAVMVAICMALMMMGNLLLTIYISGTEVAFWEAYNADRLIRDAGLDKGINPEEPGEELN